MINLVTKKQHRVFTFLCGYIATNSEAPTNLEIRQHFQLRSPATVHAILVSLEKEGLIKRTPNISRGIEIVKQSTPVCGWMDR